jgi:two-component sensor histidine kinase
MSVIDDIVENRLPSLRRRRVLAFVIGLGLFVLAFAGRQSLEPLLGENAPFVTFFVAVLFATLIGGPGPGLLVVVLSALSAAYFFLGPGDGFKLSFGSKIALGVFVLNSMLIVAVLHLLNRMVERLSDERQRGEALLHNSALTELQLQQLNSELRHRTKNIFAVFNALISQTAKSSDDIDDMSGSLTGRVHAMAAAQDLLIASRYQSVDLRKLIEDTLDPLAPSADPRLLVEGISVSLSPDVATPLGLMIHELATNAVKYGAWSNDTGRVAVTWTYADGDEGVRLMLRWDESGGPKVGMPSRKGLGTTLIEQGLPGASVTRSFDPSGVNCSIDVTFKPVTRTISKSQRH